MAEQQVVNYIKKAKAGGQSDDRTRALLMKNGWTDAEINDAFAAQDPQPQPQSQPKIQTEIQSKVEIKRPEPVTVQPTQTNYSSDFSEERPKRHFLAIFIVTAIVVAVLITSGGIVYALSTKILNPLWNPFRPNPEVVISKAWNNLSKIKTEKFNSQATISVNMKSLSTSQTFNLNADLKLMGEADNSNPDNKALLEQMDLIITGSDPSGQPLALSLVAELIVSGKNVYFKLNDGDLSALQLMISSFGYNVNDFKGKWFKFDTSTASGFSPYLDGVNTSSSTTQDASKMANEIGGILINKKVYNIKQLADEKTTSGVNYHYAVSLNRKKLNAALPDIYNVILKYNSSTDSKEKFISSVNEFLDKIGPLSIDLFIGQKDNFFHKIQIVKNDIQLEKFNDQVSGTIKLNLTQQETGINAPVQIVEPSNYVNFTDFMKSKMAIMQIQSDFRVLSSTAQSIYNSNKSYTSLCAKSMLNASQKAFGKNLTALSNSIISSGGQKPACFAGAKNFCISTQMPDGSYLCAGYNATTILLGTVKCVNANTVCK